ncbi:MAG TPA: 2Fe-2S iron-sulfur cluster-binding protein [Microthrixaceae bacterium]|nr:2Fe-2S iron-sulfur cluster-binding protein [Microthrixaceae bacterium]
MATLILNGAPVEADDALTLLEALRDLPGLRAAKDGCSPQGQCGCCTVLVDGEPRVACVTPVRRIDGRAVTTLEGLDDAQAFEWADAFVAAGASQCGFCTPGIVVRLEALRRRGTLGDPAAVDRALAAHLCRCTGWRTIHEAAEQVAGGSVADTSGTRDLDAASRRATLEGHTPQRVSPDVVLGAAGFADDTVPEGALVAVPGPDGEWVVAERLHEARAVAGKVQGRRTTVPATPPLSAPEGDWALTLRTSWVEPAYLEVDVAWCAPAGEPASVLANGGAFGAKLDSPLPAAARELAERHGRTVVARWSREDTVRLGPKRPPIAAGVRADGSGFVRVARTSGIAAAIGSVAPGLEVEEVDLVGPPTSADVRGAGWVEAAVLLAAVRGDTVVTSPDGATATATIGDGTVSVAVRCGEVLDETVLRSYCIGAAHMAIGWVTSEAIAVGDDGTVSDLTIRSFGIIRSSDMPQVEVVVEPDDRPARNASDAVLGSVAAAVWAAQGHPPTWPTGIGFAP